MKRQKNKSTQRVDPPSLAASEALSRAEISDTDAPHTGEWDVFRDLLPQGVSVPITVLPAELVSLHTPGLPFRSARQRLAALPFALEEHVGRALEHTHFALCNTGDQSVVLAAALDIELMARTLDAEPEAAIIPEQMLLPPPDGDEGCVAWRTYRKADRVLVRASNGTGFATTSHVLPHLWQLAGRPRVQNHGAPLPSEILFADNGTPPRVKMGELQTSDLRQGVFQPASGLSRPLRWLAAALAIAAVSHLILAAADTYAQKRIADDLRAEAATALVAKLPDANADDAASLLLRRLTSQNQTQTGSGFLPLMDRVSDALLTQSDVVQFTQINWTPEALRVTVEATDLEALQQIEAGLTAGGLSVSSGSATADAGAARAEMTVRP